jgi:hypothetical protein
MYALQAPAATASAQAPGIDHGLDLGVGLQFGTLGIGGQVSKLLFGNLGLRAQFNAFGFGLNHSISNVQYSAKLHLFSVPILADIYPFARGPFHLTGGVVLNQNRFSGTGVPGASGTININGNPYTSAQIGVLSAAIKYPSTGGYAGLGFGTPAKKSMVAGVFDIGVIMSKPRVVLTATNPGNDAQLTSDLAAQQATTQKSANKVSVYPVISSGLIIRL